MSTPLSARIDAALRKRWPTPSQDFIEDVADVALAVFADWLGEQAAERDAMADRVPEQFGPLAERAWALRQLADELERRTTSP